MELTDEEKQQAQECMDAIVNMWWNRIFSKMVIESKSYDIAFEETKEEMLK